MLQHKITTFYYHYASTCLSFSAAQVLDQTYFYSGSISIIIGTKIFGCRSTFPFR